MDKGYYQLNEHEYEVYAKLRVMRNRIEAATCMKPNAIVLPRDLFGWVTELDGLRVISRDTAPGLVYYTER